MAFNFRNSNIVLRRALKANPIEEDVERATYGGVAKKTIFFLVMTLLGVASSVLLLHFLPAVLIVTLVISSILTLIFGFISFFSVNACKVTGSIYCVSEGIVLGTVSMYVAEYLQGAVTAALLSTLAVFLVVTLLFTTNIVKVTNKFVKFLFIFAVSFLVSQLFLFLISLAIPTIQYGFGLQLLFSSITTLLATLYLFFDLEHIRQIVEGGAEKKYEWYVSFGLAYTVLWLYMEILRLILIFYNRD